MTTNNPNPKVSSNTQSVATRFLQDAFSQGTTEATSFVNTLIREATTLKASDLLLEPGKKIVRTRARIDGTLYHLGEISPENYKGIASRIKILAKLDPSEKRKVQEGQFTFEYQNRTINVRVEIAGTIHGELTVIRIHEIETIIKELSQLGFNGQAYKTYLDILSSRGGLILVCGPTGCGKTTTLYSTINHINQEKNLNVMTVEDPVEFQMAGVNQMQTQENIGFTFAEGLRTILRLSPDVIMVGEIRDKETVEIAVESGLTGQLVFSTLHADDAAGALFRLLDLGIESYLLSSSLVGIIAQRLVRKLCQECLFKRQPDSKETDVFTKYGLEVPHELNSSKGCFSCKLLNFKGRTGIFEVLKMDSTIRDLIRKKITENELREKLNQKGFTTLIEDGLNKTLNGQTTVEEVLRNSFKIA